MFPRTFAETGCERRSIFPYFVVLACLPVRCTFLSNLLLMKVFISHSWKNKLQAQQIADELKAAGIEPWIDASNLLPGQAIQEHIDNVLKDIDMIVLVWSKQASESNGVAAEVYTCSRLKKTIIPCLIDDTSLTTHPYLQQIKGIRFHDFNEGIGRLKMVLFNYMIRQFEMDRTDSVKAMNDFMGSLETTQHLVHQQDIKTKGTAAEKEYWIKKIQDTEKTATEKLREEERIGKEMMPYLQEKMKELEAGIRDKKGWSSIISEMKAHKHAAHPAMRTFIESVQKMHDNSPRTVTPNAISVYRDEMEKKLASSKDQLKQNFGILADLLFAASFENMRYFFLSSADHVEKLEQLANSCGAHPVVSDCAGELIKYISTPGGVIDNTQHGILGYCDDAYFIHSIISALQQEGVIDTSSWGIDWVKINAGIAAVFTLAGYHIKNTLDQHVQAYCRQLVLKYAPQQSSPGNDDSPTADDLQKAKDDLWKAKLMSLQTSMIHNPVW